MNRVFVLFVFICSLVKTDYSFSQWTQISEGMGSNRNVSSLAGTGNYLFAGCISGGGVFRSSDNGVSWQSVNSGLFNLNIKFLYYNNNILFAGTFGNGIFFSTNFGDNWYSASSGLTNLYVNYIYYSSGFLYAGTSDTLNNSGGVYISGNNGSNWNFIGLAGFSVNALLKNGNYLIAGTAFKGNSGGFYRTTNNGINWSLSNSGLPGFGIEVNYISADGANIYAGTGNGVYASNNYGSTWESISIQLSQVKVYSIALYNFIFFAGTGNGVFLSTNYGANWIEKNQGFPVNVIVNSLLINGNNILAGTKENSVWKRNISESIIINKISDAIPEKTFLNQNYPNPFNSKSKIKFDINKKSEVKITIYDLEGKIIYNLVSGIYHAGEYGVLIDGDKLASGIYFCKMKTEDYSQTRKIILIK
jgi:photosystem II stability/assembly factor-like uncharacterized protein